ncbi:hypothetical protein AB0L59_36290 [Streptomyces sp. NPDC052109]|uniref:hypothetical protein n=1 Tax=Streptomyces sp. NPDC052109 TaxID=3155527 RepID=UPI00344878EA
MIEGVRIDSAPFVRFAGGTEPPLSQGGRVGDRVFTSGQAPLAPVTHEMPGEVAAFRCRVPRVREGVRVEIDAVAAVERRKRPSLRAELPHL